MKSLEQELREGNYDINDVLNNETGERRVILARMGHHIDILAQTLEPEVLIALIENGYAEDYYDEWVDHISSRVNQKRQTLRTLATSWQFRKEIPEFKQAVREKLKTYDMVPTSMEKTMTPAQLYRTNSPLWMSGVSVNVIKNIIILENKLGKDVATGHIDEFV